LGVDAVKDAAEACERGVGRATVNLGQHDEHRGALTANVASTVRW
jgi:hypothetical protein